LAAGLVLLDREIDLENSARAGEGLVRAKFVALDTSHLCKLIHDRFERNSHKWNAAKAFEASLLEHGYVLFFCWHHFAELLTYGDQAVVAERIAYIRDLPMVAWVRSYEKDVGLGSIADILAAETEAAFTLPGSSALVIRDKVAQDIIKVGPGTEIIGPDEEMWLALQPVFSRQAEKSRKVVAISRSGFGDMSDTKISDLMTRALYKPDEAERNLQALQARLAADIKARGDKRISDAKAVAAEFFAVVKEESSQVLATPGNVVLRHLVYQGLNEGDIGPEMTLGEATDLLEFRKKLQVASRVNGIPFPDLKAKVSSSQIPSWIIQKALVRHGQDLTERKGSDLIDGYLMCLSPYIDLTLIDKRTWENARRARAKSPEFSALVGRVERSPDYSGVSKHLSATSLEKVTAAR
jgi:hypothetical protein